MATIVEYTKNGKRYVLLGTGFGTYKSAHSGFLLGDWFPTVDEGQITMAAVCDASGKIRWAHTDELIVVEVDGVRPAHALGDTAESKVIPTQPRRRTPDGTAPGD